MSEMTMLERVSRLLCKRDDTDPDGCNGPGFGPHWYAYRETAGAILQEMRYATETMKTAALDQYGFNEAGHWTAVPARVYEAMVEAALTQQL